MDTASIGKYIKFKRRQRRMTQLELAESLGISPQAVSKWERSESLPDVTLFPDIAKLFGVTVEDILQAGEPSGINPRNLVDEHVFAVIRDSFAEARAIADLPVPPDIFMLLTNPQKEELLPLLLAMEGGLTLIEEIYRHLSPAQRETAVQKILAQREYEILEPLIPFMTKNIKTMALSRLLREGEFEFLEELLPYLNREQKELLIRFVIHNNLEEEILENYIPFFDSKLRKIIKEWLAGRSAPDIRGGK